MKIMTIEYANISIKILEWDLLQPDHNVLTPI